MDSMRFKLAILNALAKYPGGRVTLDDFRREVEIIIASADDIEPLSDLSALADVDIIRSGLVLQDDAGLQVTTAGLALLHSLESNSGLSPQISSERGQTAEIVPANATLETSAVDPCEKINPKIPKRVDDANHDRLSPVDENRTDAVEALDGASQDAPAFLRRSFGTNVDSERNPALLASLLALIGAKKQFMTGLWRRHFVQDGSHQRTERPIGKMGGAAFAFLSVFVVVACVGAAIALAQIKFLKSDVAMLHRERLLLSERLGRLEQFDKKRDSDQQEQAQSKADTNKAGGGTGQTPLDLTREEVQLIREYIKPTPSSGIAAPAINVGDLIGGATIPLPSPITEKVPKLIGARFTIRNGAIIISTKNSRRADAVLTPN
jgi:hypothetical protein